MPFRHRPVQAGSDRILKAMNRGHTAGDYLRLIEKIRTARPDMALSGDFIVGFPGETEAEFRETLALVREVNYASAFTFKYSPRPGTPASEYAEQVPETAQNERRQELQALIASQQQAFNLSMVGRTLPVLIEKPGRHAGQVVGRSPYLQAVHIAADPALIGTIIHTRIWGVGSNSLSGQYAHAA